MKTIQAGGRSLSFVGISDDDPYYASLADGAEGRLCQICRRYLASDAVALDIGANIGLTAMLLGQHLTAGHVHAFEPSPTVYPALVDNLAANGMDNVSPYKLAVNHTGVNVGFLDASAFGYIDESSRLQVPAVTIDKFVAQHRLQRVDFIKIDVEGYERDVLLGAHETIKRMSPLIYLEFNSWCLIAHSRMNPLGFLEWLLRRFGHVGVVTDGGIRRLELADVRGFAHDNILHHGCVDDLVVTNDERRLRELATEP